MSTETDQRLVGILRIKGQIYGSNKGKYRYLFRPYDGKSEPLLVQTSINRTATSGDVLGIVQPTEHRSGDRFRSGNLVLKIGSTTSDSDIVTSWIYHYGIQASLRKPTPVPPESGAVSIHTPIVERTDARVYSIDPPGCTDVDDAFDFTVITAEDGQASGYQLSIHIACLGHMYSDLQSYVARAFSLYLPSGEIKHMLPVELVSQASLLAGQPRLAVTLTLTLGVNGTVMRQEFSVSRIINKGQLTYDQVDRKVKSGDPYWLALQDVVSKIRSTHPIFVAGGSRGACCPPPDSHVIVETLMILYNSIATQHLVRHGLCPVLRVHDSRSYQSQPTDSPSESRDRPITGVDTSLAKFLEMLDYQSARYQLDEADLSPSARLHWALGLTNYGHLTSPIRRFIDIYNQALLIHHICGYYADSVDLAVPNLDIVNRIEQGHRKFSRRCRIYEMFKTLGDSTHVATVIPFEKAGGSRGAACPPFEKVAACRLYNCYWPEHKVTVRLKLGIDQPEPPLYQPLEVKIAIICDPLPKLKAQVGELRSKSPLHITSIA